MLPLGLAVLEGVTTEVTGREGKGVGEEMKEEDMVKEEETSPAGRPPK